MADISEIHTLNPVWTWCNREAADQLRNLFSYEYVYWQPGRFGKKRVMRKRYLIEGHDYGDYYFLSGLVPLGLKFLHKYKIPYEYTSDIAEIEYNEPHLPNITLRDYQSKLIHKALKHGHGVLKSPTGSGKSMIMFGIMSCFDQENILVLVHSLDLVKQLYEGIKEMGLGPVSIYNTKTKEMSRITVCTVNTYYKIARNWRDHWGVILVDEAHHIGNPFDGMYFEALAQTSAPWRFGFTATVADSMEARFALAGLIGPIIGEVTMAEGQDLGFLAEPEIIFIPVELPDRVKEMRKDLAYTKVYHSGVVDNFSRCGRTAAEFEKEVERGGTVLVLVNRISHIDELLEFIELPVEVVKGSVSKDKRFKIKEDLKSGTIKGVIATTAWCEGVDIPNLTMVINAAGGKSERLTLQKIGRGLRKTETKTTVKIIDFMDYGYFAKNVLKPGKDSHILHRQSVQRWKVYTEQGWKPKLGG